MSVDVEYRIQEGPVDLKQRWAEQHQDKGSILSLCEEYASWSLPYVFPPENARSVELQLHKDSIGAQAVNHLSNKIVSTLFPPQRNFFRLHVSTEVLENIQNQVMMSGGGPEGAALVEKALLAVDEQLLKAEKKAQEYMDMVAYRPQAVETAKLLIITGNALIFRPPNQPPQVFTLRNYSVTRDISGEVIEIMTMESKAFGTFSPDIQDQIRENRKRGKQYTYKDEVVIYTSIKLEDDGRFHVYQQADHIELDTDGLYFVKGELPWIPLTWNLVRGENYGRGLVADYAGAFHAVNVLSGSLLNVAAIVGDIKFLVNPASLVDVPALNRSPPGSYHSGRADDVTAIQTNKASDVQYISAMIERYEKQIREAFLLNSSLVRQAERVTAEEIRMQAQELEMSNGGIYSRLAAQWQVPEATLVLQHTDFDGLDMGIVPQIITGMDSLSRLSELDNIRMFLADLQLLNGIPEDIRAAMDIPALAGVLGTHRQVEYKKFMKTPEQMRADQDRAIQQQDQMADRQAGRDAQVAASKEAVKG